MANGMLMLLISDPIFNMFGKTNASSAIIRERCMLL